MDYINATMMELGNPNITGDDVLIVVDMQYDFLPGGAFGVPQGNTIVPACQAYISQAHKVGAQVVFTRDYHPTNHTSFTTTGGLFPPHCLQGSRGSEIIDELVSISNMDDIVVYKGFLKCVDSFGAAPYNTKYAEGRISLSTPCSIRSTGAYALHCSGRTADNLNAPPDVTSWQGPIRNREESLKVLIDGKKGTVYICGLALDYCVLDTAVNLRRYNRKVCILVDASRAVAADHGLATTILKSTVAAEGRKFGDTLRKYKIRLAQSVEIA